MIYPLKDKSLLHDKNIHEETINNPLFKNIIYGINQDTNIDFDSQEPCFLMKTIDNNYTTISKHNRTQTFNKNKISTTKNRENAIAFSGQSKPDKKLDEIHISTNMIDNMSHYQMNKNNLKNKNILYLSTEKPSKSEPSLTNEQIKIINNTIENNPNINKINIGFENTLAGNYYATKLLSQLNPKLPEKSRANNNLTESGLKTNTSIKKHSDKKKGVISFETSIHFQNPQAVSDKLKEYFDKYNANNFNIKQSGNFNINIEFDHNKQNWQKAYHILNQLKFEKNNLI